ncbi:MAG: hypothetical protein JNL04_03595 [Rhodospirillaceae bacterium]|nr:hypothetical protein [Rhodospirillaceae bacterium]
MFSRILCALLTLLVLAACQPLPRPFEDQEKESNELLTLANRAGVLVTPIEGAPDPGALAEAIAAELRRLDVPATTRTGASNALRLGGRTQIVQVDGPRDELTISWLLTLANGVLAGGPPTSLQVPREAWAAASPEALREIAKLAAPELVDLIEGDRPASRPGPALAVWAVDGAPGDGAVSLKAALERSLRRAGYRVLAEIVDDGLVVSGAIHTRPAGNGRQRVTIVWSILSSDGTELGQIEQENVIVAGLLDGPWGEIARQIAAAAIEGITEVLQQVQAGKAS